MSLKQETRKVFEEYGLSDQEITILLTYLGNPQATPSLVAGLCEMEYNTVVTATQKFLQSGLLKEVPGVVPRYLPLEPYFTLFVKQSTVFRSEIEKIKDAVLEDQSKRFKSLEDIKNTAISEIDTAVKNQVDEFFRVSDEHDSDKQQVIESARDRFTSETKTLESDIHSRIETDYAELDSDIKQMDGAAAKVWDDHSAKFTNDNNELNAKIDQIADAHNSQTKSLEQNLHGVLDNLNGQLKTIADGFVSNYETGINDAKSGINSIISDLLKDFAERVNNLENEMKKDLDEHVENHKENAQELRPTLEEILAKYMDRMHKVVEDLKRQITKLLFEHIDQLKSTTESMQDKLKARVDERQDELVGEVKSFEQNTVVLIDNLEKISGDLGELGTVLASRGSAFKALLLGKHKNWVTLKEEITEKITDLSDSMKEKFVSSTSKYIGDTEETKSIMKNEITEILSSENSQLKGSTEELDKKAQNTVNAELEGLASDLSSEIDSTLKKNIQHCKDTTIKLKDSIQSNFSSHKEDYDAAINRHNKKSIDHYDDCDREVKNKVDAWYSEMDKDHNKAKNDTTTETTNQTTDVNKFRTETKDKNIEHSKTFEADKDETKKKQTEIYDNRLAKVRADFDSSKKETSDKINAEIELFKNECKDTDDKLHAMLEDHKSKYQENATNLQQYLTKTITENIKDTRDAIADFTLQFMNSIDEAYELAENNEEKLNDIFNSSAATTNIVETTTWHIVGLSAIQEYIANALRRVKSSVIIITHQVVPKILESISETAYHRKTSRLMYTTHWEPEYEPILMKMKSLGNIQFRQLKAHGEFIALTRDAEEVLIAPVVNNDTENAIAIVSTEEGYCKMFSQFIGPMFQANSRPI